MVEFFRFVERLLLLTLCCDYIKKLHLSFSLLFSSKKNSLLREIRLGGKIRLNGMGT